MPRFFRYHSAIPLGSFTLKNTPPMPVTCSICNSFALVVVSPDSRCCDAQPHTTTNGKKLARRWIRITFMLLNIVLGGVIITDLQNQHQVLKQKTQRK